jgi:hypothetical protein
MIGCAYKDNLSEKVTETEKYGLSNIKAAHCGVRLHN